MMSRQQHREIHSISAGDHLGNVCTARMENIDDLHSQVTIFITSSQSAPQHLLQHRYRMCLQEDCEEQEWQDLDLTFLYLPSSQEEHLCMTVYFVTLQKHGPIRACPRLSQKSAQKPPTNVPLYGYNSMKARKRLATEWILEEKKKRRMEGQVTHKLLTSEQTVSHELTGTHGARPLSHGYSNARSWYSSGGWRASRSRAKERKNE